MLFCILVSFFCEFFHRAPSFQCLGWLYILDHKNALFAFRLNLFKH